MNKSGWLKKRADVLQLWNPRFFEVDPVSHTLTYYKEEPSEPRDSSVVPRGILGLIGCVTSGESRRPRLPHDAMIVRHFLSKRSNLTFYEPNLALRTWRVTI